MSERTNTISFIPVNIPRIGSQPPYFRVFYAARNGKSEVRKAFHNLPNSLSKNVKELVKRMANFRPYYKSDYINWDLKGKGFTYGEISPRPYRFFFFRSGDCLVFFGHVCKKVNELHNSTYKNFQAKKDEYEKEFTRLYRRI